MTFDNRQRALESFEKSLEEFKVEGVPSWFAFDPVLFLSNWFGVLKGVKSFVEKEIPGATYSDDQDIHSVVKLGRILKLYRFSDKDMKYLWDKVGAIYPSSPVRGQGWFSNALYYSFAGYESQKVTLGEANKWKDKLIGALESVSTLIDETPSNMHDWEKHARDEIRKYPFAPSEVDHVQSAANVLDCLYFRLVLKEMKKGLEKTEYQTDFYGSHVRGSNAERMYFIRSLTAAFIQKTGKPYRKVVALTVSRMFDCDLSESEVTRATRDVDLTVGHGASQCSINQNEGFFIKQYESPCKKNG